MCIYIYTYVHMIMYVYVCVCVCHTSLSLSLSCKYWTPPTFNPKEPNPWRQQNIGHTEKS